MQTHGVQQHFEAIEFRRQMLKLGGILLFHVAAEDFPLQRTCRGARQQPFAAT